MIMLDFWINVRNELEYKGLSQKDLALKINESYNTLQSWINKDRLPNVEQAVKIAELLNVSVEYLVKGNISKSEKSISQKHTLKTEGLSELQIAHIQTLINDILEVKNKDSDYRLTASIQSYNVLV